jgi:WD40 repeat protein
MNASPRIVAELFVIGAALGVMTSLPGYGPKSFSAGRQTQNKPEPLKGDHGLAVKYSPNGQWLATAEMNGTVRLWNTKDQQDGTVLAGPARAVRSLAFSADSASLACACDDGNIYLWETFSAKRRATLKGHSDWVFAVAFSPDGRMLVSAGGSSKKGVLATRELKVWNTHEGTVLRNIECHEDIAAGGPSALAFVPGSELLAVACCNEFKGAKVLDIVSGKEVKRFTYEQGFPYAVAVSPDCKWIVTAGGHSVPLGKGGNQPVGHLKLWEWESGKLRQTLVSDSKDGFRDVAFSKDGTRLVAGTMGLWTTLKLKSGAKVSAAPSLVYCWDTATWKCLWTAKGGIGGVNSADIAPDCRTIVVNDTSGSMLIDATTGQVLRYLITSPFKLD